MSDAYSYSLRGQKIVVTGAAGHLGRALCKSLVADGAVVFAVDIDSGGLASLENELGTASDNFHFFSSDLSDESHRARLAEEVAEITTSLDGVVFGAAFVGTSDLEGWAVDFEHQSVLAWRQALELNLTAPFHLAQLLIPLLLQGKDPSIVSIGSIYGSVGPDWTLYEGLDMSNPAGYAASKAGLVQLTRWLSTTLAPTIRANSVSLGGIFRHQPERFVQRYVDRTPLGRMGVEADAVGPIGFLLSDASAYVTGQNIVVDGGYSAL